MLTLILSSTINNIRHWRSFYLFCFTRNALNKLDSNSNDLISCPYIVLQRPKKIKVKLAFMGVIGSLKIRWIEKHVGFDNILNNSIHSERNLNSFCFYIFMQNFDKKISRIDKVKWITEIFLYIYWVLKSTLGLNHCKYCNSLPINMMEIIPIIHIRSTIQQHKK